MCAKRCDCVVVHLLESTSESTLVEGAGLFDTLEEVFMVFLRDGLGHVLGDVLLDRCHVSIIPSIQDSFTDMERLFGLRLLEEVYVRTVSVNIHTSHRPAESQCLCMVSSEDVLCLLFGQEELDAGFLSLGLQPTRVGESPLMKIRDPGSEVLHQGRLDEPGLSVTLTYIEDSNVKLVPVLL